MPANGSGSLGRRGVVMNSSLRANLPSPQRKSLRMPGETNQRRGETNPKPLRTDDFRRLIGSAIETALRNSAIEKKTAAFDMGYGENQASLSNWIRGEETPQFAKLWVLGDRFRQELVLALAASCSVGVEVETIVKLRRQA